MADKIGEVYVEIKARQDKYKKDLKEVENYSKKKGEDSAKGFQQGAEKVPNAFRKIATAAKVAGAAIAGAFVVQKFVGVAKAAINTAKEFELLRARIRALKGSQEEANKTFAVFQDIAKTTPFDLKSLTQAGAALEAFGINSQKHLKTTADLAAYMGVTAEEAASAWGRAWAGGAGAADIFRERGVLNLIKMRSGIEDLTKLTKDEFRNVMIKTFTDVGGGIAGATDIMAKTVTGKISNMRDAFDAFSDAVGGKVLPIVGKLASGFGGFISSITPVESQLSKVTEASYEEQVQFEILAGTIEKLAKKTKLSADEKENYSRAIKTINDKYGDYLGNLLTEKTSYDDLKVSIDNARQALIDKAEAQAALAIQEDLGSALKEQLKTATELATERKRLEADLKVFSRDNAKSLEAQTEEYEKQKKAVDALGGAEFGIAPQRGGELEKIYKLQANINALAIKEQEAREAAAEAAEDLNFHNETNAELISKAFEYLDNTKTTVSETSEKTAELAEKTEKVEGFTRKIPAEIDQLTDGLINSVNAADLMVDPLKKAVEETKKVKEEASKIDEAFVNIDNNLTAGIVNGLTDAILEAKNLGQVLSEIGKRMADIAIGDIAGGLLSLIPGGGILGGIGKLFGFSQGGQLSFAGNIPKIEPIKAANGLSGVVPPGFPSDSYVVPVAMTSGERFTVETKAQQARGSNVNVTFNVNAMNPIDMERYLKTDGRSALQSVLSDINSRGH